MYRRLFGLPWCHLLKTWAGLWGIGLFFLWVGWRLHLEGAAWEHFTPGGKKDRIKTHGYISLRCEEEGENPKYLFCRRFGLALMTTRPPHTSPSLHTPHLQQHLLGCADNPHHHTSLLLKHILVCIITSILTGRTGAILGRHIPL